MKRVLLATGIALASVFGTFGAYATEQNSVDWKKISELPDGVHRIKSEKGIVKSFIVVGTARISQVLGPVNGLRTAQKRAKLQAKAEIIKWLKSKVKSFESSSDESIIMMSGDGSSVSETGKSVEKSTEKYEEFAEGLVRGTMVVYSAIRPIGDEQEVVIVLAWSAKNVKNANQVQSIMSGKKPLTETSADKKSASKKTNSLPNEEIISDEASEY